MQNTNNAVLIPDHVKVLVEKEIVAFLEGAQISSIDTEQQYINSGALVTGITKYAKMVESERDSLVRPYNNKVKDINSYMKIAIEKLDSTKLMINRAIQGYQKKQELIRIELQRKLDEEARKKRERAEAEARAQREKEEAERRKAEEAERQAETARQAAAMAEGEERRRLEAEAEAKRKEAEKANAKANQWGEKAETKTMQSESIVAPTISMAAPKIAGRSTVIKYRASVVDKIQFVKWCVEYNKLQYITVDEGALSKMLQASKGLETFPGVECKKEEEYRNRV